MMLFKTYWYCKLDWQYFKPPMFSEKLLQYFFGVTNHFNAAIFCCIGSSFLVIFKCFDLCYMVQLFI